MIADLQDYAKREWGTWFPGESPRDLRVAVIARGAVRPRRGVVVMFNGEENQPRITIKVALDDASEFLEREYSSLSALLRIAPAELRQTMPVPLGLDWIGELRIAAFTAVPGRQVNLPSMLAPQGWIASRRAERLLGRIMSWASAMGSLKPQCGSARDGMTEVQSHFRLLPEDGCTAVLADAWHVLDQHVGTAAASLSLCWQHGDLAVGNVLVTSRDIYVIDWECAGNDYEPWFDQAYALAGILFQARSEDSRGSVEEVTRRALDERGWAGQVVRRAANAYWRYPLPVGAGLVTACMRAAVRSHSSGRAGWERWRELALALVANRSWTGCEWLWRSLPSSAL